jgi:Ca-activated chloride channel family protein
VGLLAFNDQLQLLEPLREFSANRSALRERVRGLIADGGTAIYDATAAGFERVRKLAGNGRINAVVVLTDGEDTDSHKNADDVVNAVRAQGDSSRRVRIFTIAYSAGAQGAEEALRNIAQASGGQEYKGDTEDIESVYRSISSFF